MKKIITLSILFLLISCGQENKRISKDSDNFTLVCDVQDEIRDMNSKVIGSSKRSLEFIFIDKQLNPYQCSWGDRMISCWTDPSKRSKNEQILFSIDREKGEISGFEQRVNKDGLETIVVLEGNCRKIGKLI
jgi:hypothetical protein